MEILAIYWGSARHDGVAAEALGAVGRSPRGAAMNALRPWCQTCEAPLDEPGQCEKCREYPRLVAVFREGQARLVTNAEAAARKLETAE